MRVEVSGKLHCERLKSGGYRVTREIRFQTGIKGQSHRIYDEATKKLLLELEPSGWIVIEPPYQWDGASFIVRDRPANMRASLLHDALYQLMRARLLSQEFRGVSDQLFRDMYLDDGDDVPDAEDSAPWYKKALRSFGKGLNRAVVKAIATVDYAGLRVGAAHAASPQEEVEAVDLVFP